ncbi:hypothetical protein TYRP_015268 [Tyrophagus putrescentiae]|nr:hypothetical protein TYRP_015268 [Tyrophagus putrescentiae]
MMGLPLIWVGVYLCAQRMMGLPLIWVGVYLCAQRMMGLPLIWVGVYLCAQRMMGLPLIRVRVYLCAQRMMGLPLIWVGVYLCAQRMMGLPLIWVGVYLCAQRMMGLPLIRVGVYLCAQRMMGFPPSWVEVYLCAQRMTGFPPIWVGVYLCAQRMKDLVSIWTLNALLSWEFPLPSEPLSTALQNLIALLGEEDHQRSPAHHELGVHTDVENSLRSPAHRGLGVQQDAENPLEQNEGPAAHSAPRGNAARRGRPPGRGLRSRVSTVTSDRVTRSRAQATRQQSSQSQSRPHGRPRRVASTTQGVSSASSVNRHERERRQQYDRNRRANMSAEQSQQIRSQNSQQHQNAYSSLSDADRRNRQNRDAQRHQEAFNLMNEAERQAQREQNAQQHRNAYQVPERGAAIAEQNLNRYHRGRATQRPSKAAILNAEGRLRYGIPEEDYLGGLTSVSIPGHGPYVFKIQGITYHYTFNINQIREGELGQRNQLYILDTADQTAHRQTNARQYNHNLRPYILNVLKHCLDEANETYENLRRMFEMANVEEVAVAFAPVQPGRPNADRERLPEAREIVDEQDVLFRQALSDFMLHRKCGHENPQAVCMRSRKAPRYSPPAVAENAGQQPQLPDPAQQAGQGNENANEQQNDDIVVPPPQNERQAEESSSEEDDIDSFVVRDRPRNRASNNQPTVDPPVDENENRELFEGENEFHDEDSFDQNVDDMFDRHFDFDPEGSIHVDTPPVIPENNVTGRSGYIQPREVCGKAMYRLFSLKTHFNSHAVIRLDVHLEERQQVYFADGQEAQVARPNRKTTLTAWFELNQRCREKFDDLAPGAVVQPMSVHRYRTAQEHFVYDKIQVPCEYYFWKERKTTTDPEFREFLLQIGDGNFGDISLFTGVRTLLIPERYLSPYHRMEDIPRFVDEIYDEDTLLNPRQDQMSANALSKSAILAATNEQVAMLNSVILNRMTSFSKVFYSTDSVVVERPENQNDVPIENFHEANPPGIPPHELHLKEGCIVMLCRNWSVEDGLTNGTRLRVVHLRPGVEAGQPEPAQDRSFARFLECEVITNHGDANLLFDEQNYDQLLNEFNDSFYDDLADQRPADNDQRFNDFFEMPNFHARPNYSIPEHNRNLRRRIG